MTCLPSTAYYLIKNHNFYDCIMERLCCIALMMCDSLTLTTLPPLANDLNLLSSMISRLSPSNLPKGMPEIISMLFFEKITSDSWAITGINFLCFTRGWLPFVLYGI